MGIAGEETKLPPFLRRGLFFSFWLQAPRIICTDWELSAWRETRCFGLHVPMAIHQTAPAETKRPPNTVTG